MKPQKNKSNSSPALLCNTNPRQRKYQHKNVKSDRVLRDRGFNSDTSGNQTKARRNKQKEKRRAQEYRARKQGRLWKEYGLATNDYWLSLPEPDPALVWGIERDWCRRNNFSNPSKTKLLRHFNHSDECKYTFALCSELYAQERACTKDDLMSRIVSLPATIQQQIFSMVRPTVNKPFVPGIYVSLSLIVDGFDTCAQAAVLVIYPGMKTARWAYFQDFSHGSWPCTNLEEHLSCYQLDKQIAYKNIADWNGVRSWPDRGVLLDYALDPSLPTYEAHITSDAISIPDQKGYCSNKSFAGKAVPRSRPPPPRNGQGWVFHRWDGVSDWWVEEHISDWVIEHSCLEFVLKVTF